MPDMAYVEPELHRGRADQRLHLPVFELLLGLDPHLPRKRAVVHLDIPAIEELLAERLRSGAGVDEYQDGLVLIDKFRYELRLRRKLASRVLHVDGKPRGRRDVHEMIRPVPAEETGDIFRISDSRREGDPLELPCLFDDPFECNRELGAPLASGKLMDLVDNDIPDTLQVLPQVLSHEECLDGLGCGYQEVGRIFRLACPLRLCRIAVTDAYGQAELSAPPFES